MKITKREKVVSADLPGLEGTPVYESAKRQVREDILAAFDIYKSNVFYGIDTETAEQKQMIVAWYRSLCDLNDDAFASIPKSIKRYLK